MSGGRNSFHMAVDTTAFNALIAGLEEDVQTAVRPAAQAGAQVLYEAAVRNVNAIGRKTGNLAGAIYQAYSPENSGAAKATYRVSWNARKAPHGGLVEFGHIQRYAVHMAPDGRFYTLVRANMRGKPKPRSGATQAEKDAYYVLRAGGPRQIAAKPFMRPVLNRQSEAIAAIADKFWQVLRSSK